MNRRNMNRGTGGIALLTVGLWTFTASAAERLTPASPPPRQGGEACADAFVIQGPPSGDNGTLADKGTARGCAPCAPDFVVEGPGSWTGTTCGAGNDCPLRPSEDHIYQVTIPNDGTWQFDVCGATWDTSIYVGTSCCGGEIGFDDDGCSATPYAYDSQLLLTLPAGVYYVDIEGYDPEDCGAYELHVLYYGDSCIECPLGGVLENEPECHDNYIDVTNGGCGSVPPVFTPLTCGATICGQGGTFLFNGSEYRDTDWFEVTLTSPTMFNFTVTADFPPFFGLLEQVVPGVPGCDNLTGLSLVSATSVRCVPETIKSPPLGPGTYYFFIGAQVFTGIPCGSEYLATLEFAGAPTGACCAGSGVCSDGLTSTECAALYGSFYPGASCADIVCEPFFCAAGSETCDEYIGDVRFADPPFSNPSDCAPGGYADYTNLCIPMEIGRSYDITVENPVQYSADQCGIWIDWNDNYTFEPAEAQLVTGSPGGGPYTATIVPPAGAVVGDVRMRIRVMYTGVLGPCGTTPYGEVEDYCVSVSPGICGDYDNDGEVNVDDYLAFLDAFGTCVGELTYLPAADFDADACITLVDYQAWLQCYAEANGGTAFQPPAGRPRAPQPAGRPDGGA